MSSKFKRFFSSLIILSFILMLIPQNTVFAENQCVLRGELEINSTVTCTKPTAIDAWKITLPSDGTLTITNSYGHDYGHGFEMQDERLNDGEILADANGGYLNPSLADRTCTLGLQKGTYYIMVSTENDCKGYTLSSSFTPTFLPKDPEPNNTANRALPLNPEQSVTGHLGYFRYWLNWDRDDWYRILVTTEGTLALNVNTANSLKTDLILWNDNVLSDTYAGHIVLEDVDSGNPDAEINLRPGMYYLQLSMETDYGNNYGEYTLTSSFTPYAPDNDPEPNDSPSSAVSLGSDDSRTGYLGHISYFKDNTSLLNKDIEDWYRVQLPAEGTLNVTVNTSAELDADINLVDSDGSEVLESDTRTGTLSKIESYLPSGTYYIRVFHLDDNQDTKGSYTITTGFATENKGAAKELKVNSTAGGSLPNEDSAERWYINLPDDGTLSVSIPHDKLIYLYDRDGNSYIDAVEEVDDYNCTVTASLKAGTYYIEVYANSSPGEYQISSQFNTTTMPNDSEPNDLREGAEILGASDTRTGHLGFYSIAYDFEDWYKVEVGTEGTLELETATTDTLDLVLELQYSEENLSYIKRAEPSGSGARLQATLKPGTYYVYLSVLDPYNSEKTHGEYILNSNFTEKEPGINDLEPNDAIDSALPLGLFDSVTGCIGHESYGLSSLYSYDKEDWYQLSMSSEGILDITLNTSHYMDSALILYNENGEYVAEDNIPVSTDTFLKTNLKPGIYYLLVSFLDDPGIPSNYRLTTAFKFLGTKEFGDVDGDGYLTTNDSIKVKSYVLDKTNNPLTETEITAADMDGDGKITSTDYAILKRRLRGK